MAYTVAGLVLALTVAVAAALRSRRAGGYYASGWYGMSAATHRRYAVVSLAFAAFFAAAAVLRYAAAGIDALALYALIAVFYATSFLRGASDRER